MLLNDKQNINKAVVNELINGVISGIHEEWPIIYKIRYIYLGIGKALYKDTDFFFSVDGKLGEDNLSISDIKDIYNNNFGRIIRNELKVICKSASYILKMAYEKIGIRSDLIETNTTIAAVAGEDEFLINHWFLAIHDDEKNRTYFATLTPDLPYIQLNMDTRHFGSDIPYKRDYNGKVMQIYKGDEIKHSIISREELKEIDKCIGYVNNAYNYNDKGQLDGVWNLQYDNASLHMLRDSLKGNKLFYELEIAETDFYRSLMDFSSNNKKLSLHIDSMNDITLEDWEQWIRILCRYILGKIEDILGYDVNVLPSLDSRYWNYEAWLLNLCTQIQYNLFLKLNNGVKDNFSDVYVDVFDFKYSKWSKKVKSRFGKISNMFDYDNVLLILDKMTSLVNCVKNDTKGGDFNNLLYGLAYHFIDYSHLYESNISKDGFLSNYYIANKFDIVFRRVFGCNELVTEFNHMGYAEQVAIIKDVLVMMFPEITKSNSDMLKDYDDGYSAVFNRIQLYPIKSKKDGHYSILFNILGDEKNGDYYFLYNDKKNTFKVSNGLDIYSDYIIVSDRMKNRISIDELERIDNISEDIKSPSRK